MTATTAIVQEGLHMIPLASINPNPDNPRKHFDEAALKELAASIKAQGVWEPIVVRPDPIKPKTYELIIGERRWRASKLAGKSDIPAIVRTLSDRGALEAMILENLQREDVHPIEEARGYQLLLESGADNGSPAHTVDSIAAKIGKSASYVYGRLKLLVLIPVAVEAFHGNHISPAHAVLIARLQPAEQLLALAACFQSHTTQDEEANLKKLDLEKAKFADIADILGLAIADEDLPEELRILSEKGLREWIADNVNLKLKGVPWDLADAQLLPGAGACLICPKRSLSNPMLFAELTEKGEDRCFDPACYQHKRQAFVKLQFQQDRDRERAAKATGTEDEFKPLRQLSEQQAYVAADPDQKTLKHGQWLEAKKGECPTVESGVITKGEHAGEQRLVCANAKCKVHKHNLSKSPAPSSSPQERAKTEAEEKAQQELEDAWYLHLSGTLRTSVDGPDRAGLLLMGRVVMTDFFYSIEEFYGRDGGVTRKSEEKFMSELASLPLAKAWSRLIEYVVFHFSQPDAHAMEELDDFLKARKFDLKKMRKDFEAKFKASQASAADSAKGQKKGVSDKKTGGTAKPSRSRR